MAPLYVRLLDLGEEPEKARTRGGKGRREINPENQEPFIVNRHGDNGSDRVHPVNEPVPTATCRAQATW